jgi:predicted ATPase
MLSNCRVEGFKSIREMTEFPLTPLTIITGANSCGKSAFLQSILMVAQTIQHQNANIPLVLNGSILSLGGPELIINDDSRTKELKIGITYRPASANKIKVLEPSRYYKYFEYGPDERLKPVAESILESVSVDVVFQVDAETQAERKSGLNAGFAVNQSHVQVTAVSGNGREYEFAVMAIKSGSNASEAYRYRMNATQKSTVEYLLSLKHVYRYDEDKLSCGLRHFLPDNLQVKRNTGADKVVALQKGAESLTSEFRFDDRLFADSKPEIKALTENMRAIMLQRLDEMTVNDEEEKDAARAIISSGSIGFGSKYDGVELRYLPVWHSLRTLLETDQEYIQACKDAMARAIKQEDDSQTTIYTWWITEPIDAMEKFFSSSLLYLGPLREEPKSLYASKMNFNADNIGSKGEFAAQVFLDNKDAIIRYVAPESIESPEGKLVLIEGSLQEAVDVWAKYLTIAEKIIVEDIGRNGYRILVRQPGEEKEYDISDVGVGISQVLPILVMGLLSGVGSSMLIEQPELHLHPKVQSRLADFFLSMILAGKQCIAETHSEHIINRLRFRIVQSPNPSTLRKNTTIYFTDNQRGFSEYRQVEINDYGVIREWPVGFFDQTRKEITATISAEALKKSTRHNTN